MASEPIEKLAREAIAEGLFRVNLLKADRDAIGAIMDALSEAGLEIVPVEPTPPMIAAGWAAIRANVSMRERFCGPGPGLVEAYRSMLAAAAPPATEHPTP